MWITTQDLLGLSSMPKTAQATQQIVEDKQGKPMLAPYPPSSLHRWNGKAWEITAENQQQLLVDSKTRKLSQINAAAQTFVSQVAKLDETPDFEQATWQEQANEARAWFADNNTPTPKLALLAQMRGVLLDVLRQKCYEKAQLFYQLSFVVAGKRQGDGNRCHFIYTQHQKGFQITTKNTDTLFF